MGSLKSLECEYPIIDSDFQNFCASHGIFSVEDILIHDLYMLVAFAEQQSTSERLKQGITQILSIIDGQHQPWLNGMELLEDAQQNKQVLSTGCEGIDMLLQGGLCVGHLTELVGPSSSGKTQICLKVASGVATRYMGGVVFIDTGNSFSPLRIAHFINQIPDTIFKEVKQNILEKVMSQILCHSVFDIFAMLDVVHQLEYSLRSQVQTGADQVRLLIVDSISSLITPILGGSGSHGRALMISAGFLLKKLAHEHNLAVVPIIKVSILTIITIMIHWLKVTNHMVGGEGGILKPALGESWKSIPHVRLLLSRDPGSSICHMSILKHSYMASGRAARFMI
ncbi:DNA repair protein RAD51 homolog 4 isoform X1 [Vitis riparia]|uniref:DNA repair protein RAD51 homolog 4 isoform X1 n=1 Tax=Vitis riparia TaxID=96939 RepID=UPI00155A197A|nr:DNA repair protein RAD51 homolog 4 isoform X1 [Vitis riparia]